MHWVSKAVSNGVPFPSARLIVTLRNFMNDVTWLTEDNVM